MKNFITLKVAILGGILFCASSAYAAPGGDKNPDNHLVDYPPCPNWGNYNTCVNCHGRTCNIKGLLGSPAKPVAYSFVDNRYGKPTFGFLFFCCKIKTTYKNVCTPLPQGNKDCFQWNNCDMIPQELQGPLNPNVCNENGVCGGDE